MTELSTNAAALRAGVTAQTIRVWCQAGHIAGRRIGTRNVWLVEAASLDTYIESRGIRMPQTMAVSARLEELEREVEQLRNSNTAQVERERDRYRADSIAVRAAATSLNAATADVLESVAHAIAVMRAQSDALTQLLLPGSAAEENSLQSS